MLSIAVGVAAVGILAFLYVVFSAASKPDASDLASFRRGAMAKLEIAAEPPPQPARALQDASGQPTALAAYRGQVVLVNFWATWCAPCVAEMPTLAALQRRFAGRKFRVVPVSIDEVAAIPRAKTMLARLGGGVLGFTVDPSRGSAFDARAGGVPTSILYDRRGDEIARLTGEADWSGPEAAALIEAALARDGL